MHALTDRQRRFVAAFLDKSEAGGRLFAAKAARIAGYKWPRQQGARLMTFAHVKAEIDRRQEEIIPGWIAFNARLDGKDPLKTPKPKPKSNVVRIPEAGQAPRT